MKDTLTEIRTIYKETTVEWMKPRIKSMIGNIRKQKKKQTIRTTRRKRIQKNEDNVSSFWDNSKRSNICIIRVTGRRQRARNWKSI